ncbi:MAG: hypothetical protein EBU88_14875, partial [Acidobacteria bacterium]|nr:hypothetical protein [Acidobacteriota bacterium]
MLDNHLFCSFEWHTGNARRLINPPVGGNLLVGHLLVNFPVIKREQRRPIWTGCALQARLRWKLSLSVWQLYPRSGRCSVGFTPHVDCGDNVVIVNAEKV